MLDAYLDPWLSAREMLEPDGFRTGDQGWFDADGNLYLVGRRANRISMAGMKFFAEEVEEVLDAHPRAREPRLRAAARAAWARFPWRRSCPRIRRGRRIRGADRVLPRAAPGLQDPARVPVVEAIARTSSGKLPPGAAGDRLVAGGDVGSEVRSF